MAFCVFVGVHKLSCVLCAMGSITEVMGFNSYGGFRAAGL